MADRNSGLNKKIPQNHKKKRNKVAKRKGSANKFSTKSPNKLNSAKNNKFSNVHPTGNFTEEKHDNSLTERNSFYSPKRECHEHELNERTHKISPSERDKYKHDLTGTDSNRMPSRELGEEHKGYYDRNRVGDRRISFNKTSVFDDESYERTSQTPENTEFLLQRVAFLANQVDTLSQENLRLNQTLYDIKYNWAVFSESDVEIIFKKPELSEKFAYVLQNLVNKLLNGQISIEEVDKLSSSTQQVETRDSPEPDCLFAVDSSADPQLNESTPIPMYEASFHEILESPNDSTKKVESGSTFSKNCFNCGEDHHMTNCPHKLDYRKIAIARKRQRKTNFLSNTRYHVHGKNESDFKPGIISDELREALNLEINQIPPYVYRMRVLDYPPGWLCEAAVESSGITLYGSDGKVEREENCEDGEVDTTSIKVQYDPDKLIDYPGFNVPLPPDIIDECFELGLPPLQTHQLRCLIERNMARPDVKPNRKRKLTLRDNRPTKFQRCEEDMEIDDSGAETNDSNEFVSDFVPPLPESAPPLPPPLPPPPPPPPGDDSEISEDLVLSKFASDSAEESSLSAVDHLRIKSCSDFSSGTSSPSLAELEELKKKLVRELGIGTDDAPSSSASVDEDSNLNPDLAEDKHSDENYIIEDEFIASEDSNELSNVSEASSMLNKTNEPECSEPLQRTSSKSKFMTLGTPSLSRHSSFSRLPDYEKFSENVSSHIPFENLPNSTGTYSRMKNVLKKVKEKINSLIQ